MAAKIQWDETGKHYFESGVDHGVLYKMTKGSDNTWSYGAGVPWNGLTAVSESPDGAEATDLFADNSKYATLRSAETFGFTIEAYTYPDEFAECDGTKEAKPGVFFGQQFRVPFGFCYRTKVGSDTDTSFGDYKLHLVYNCSASPSDKSYETINDSPDAITFSWECKSTPVAISTTGYNNVSTIVIDSRKVSKTKLDALEAILYGSTSAEATFPTPETVISTLSGT